MNIILEIQVYRCYRLEIIVQNGIIKVWEMVYKPLDRKAFLRYIKMVGWTFVKGSIDWNLYDENNVFLCSIKIAHGKNTKEEIVAHSVDKTKKIFKEKGLVWPPQKKKK